MKKSWMIFIVLAVIIAMAYEVLTIPVLLMAALVVGVIYFFMRSRQAGTKELFTYVVVDTETTGLDPAKHEVVSVSAIKFATYINKEEDTAKIEQYEETFNRYYYAKRYNDDAIRINGLDSNKINSKRWNANYPQYFKRDFKAFLDFVDGCDFIVGHNIKFDLSFLPRLKCAAYCTMGERKISLGSRAHKYGLEFSSWHQSDEDARITAAIFFKQLQNGEPRALSMFGIRPSDALNFKMVRN